MEERQRKDSFHLPSINPDKSFITDISKSKDSPTQDQIDAFRSLIKQQMQSLPEDLENVLKKHEKDYLNAFKYQIFNLQSQITQLKKAANSTDINQRFHEEKKRIQQSIDWYKQESQRLKSVTEDFKNDLEVLKAKNNELQQDVKYFKSKLKSTKRKLKSKASVGEKSINEASPSSKPFPFIASSTSGKLIEDLLNKYDQTDTELYKELEILMEKQEKHFEHATRHYKSIISNERRKMRTFSVMRSSQFTEKSEMETLFLDCVEEVKQEVGHRRAKSLKTQKFGLKSKLLPSPKTENFSPADKRRILELLISNEQVLMMLYEKLFPFRNKESLEPETGLLTQLNY
jgi:hypothetical protein